MRGHIYRRTLADGTPGRWHAVIDLPPGPGGKRRQKTTTHDTRRDAQAWLAKTSEEIRTLDLPDETITVGVYLTQWLAGKQLRPSTRADYTRHIEQIYLPALGHLRLAALRPRHIEDTLRSLQEGRRSPLSASTLRRVHATLHSALATAVKRGLIRRNPADTVELPKPEPYRPTIWTRDQADHFLRATETDPLGLLFRVMLMTGIRRGEAIGLQWGDVDLDDAALHIKRAITLVAGDLVVGPPKTDAGRRTVWVDQVTLERLTQLHRRALLAHDWTGGLELDDTPVFTTTTGIIHPAHASRRFTTCCKRADVPLIRLHDLRHTSASLGLAAGEPLLHVSRRLGHSSITVTADVYSHITPSDAKTAAATLHHSITTR